MTSAIVRAKFWTRVRARPEGSCWLWSGACNEHGYGRLRVEGHNLYAHRLSYELHHGPVPPGMKVLHRCDVTRCVNPAHLFLGTQADNVADAVAKGRHSRGASHGRCVAAGIAKHPYPGTSRRGESNGNAKLTEDDVRIIRNSEGTSRQVGLIFGVRGAVVRDIRRGKAWRHVS